MNDRIHTRVSELLGTRYPIVQAPMGWIARSQLASAVSEAGGFGIIETSSGELGAEGVQLGTRMVSAVESPVHDAWEQAIVAAAETDTVFLDRHSRPGLRAAGRIDAVLPVADSIDELVTGFTTAVADLANRFAPSSI